LAVGVDEFHCSHDRGIVVGFTRCSSDAATTFLPIFGATHSKLAYLLA